MVASFHGIYGNARDSFKRMSILQIRLVLSLNSEEGRLLIYGYLVTDLSGSVLINLLTYRGMASIFHISTEGQENDLAVTGLETRGIITMIELVGVHRASNINN